MIQRFTFARGLTLGVIVLGAVFAAGAAQARPAACLWEHLPKAKRDAIIAAGLQGGPDAAQQAITDDDRKAGRTACGYTASPDLAVSASWASVIYQHLTELWIAQNLGIPATKLDAAWKAEDPMVKAKLEEVTRAQQPAPPELIAAARVSFSKALGLPKTPSDEITDKFIIYMDGRTLQKIYEPQL